MVPTQEGFVTVDDARLAGLIRSASRRLIVVAPAVTTGVAEAIAKKWKELGRDAVSVVLDVGLDPYHIGYGDPDGLRILQETAREVGSALRQQPGVRIGLVVSDDVTLVYSPTPRSIEAAPGEDEKPVTQETPNAILLGAPPADLERQLAGEDGSIGEHPADEFTLRKVNKDLEKNPPRKFEITRTERVFNAKLEFVEFTLTGAALSRRKAPIPQHLLKLPGGADAQKVLEAHFRLIEKGGPIDDKKIADERRALEKKYLFNIPKFGNVILRETKGAFLKGVKDLEEKIEKFKCEAKETLAAEIQKNRTLITDALLPNLEQSPPAEWEKFGVRKGSPTARIREFLEKELSDAYGDPEAILDKVKLDVIFKGVTYQTLQDKDFVKQATERLRMTSLYEEHESAPMRQDRPDGDLED